MTGSDTRAAAPGIEAGKPTSLQERFEVQEDEVRLLNYRRGAFLAALFIALGAGMDLVAYGDSSNPGYEGVVGRLFMLRMACSSGLLFVLFLLYRVRSRSRRTLHLLGHLVALLPMVTIHGMLVETGGGDSPYYAGLNLVMVGAVLLLRWRCADGLINSLLCIAGYLGVAFGTKTGVESITIALFFLFVTAAFVCIGLYFYNRLRFAEFCLREEVMAQQEELTENHRKLQDLDEAKTRFFANISHELRTPLTLILAPIEKMHNLNAVRNDAQLAELVEGLEDNGMRLLRLINDILDLVRMDSGDMPMRPECFSPFTFIDGLGRNLQPMADRKRINLSWNAACGEEEEVYLDRDRLEKVVLNLAVNALKFTPTGGEVSLTAGLESGRLILKVTDNGAGMREDQVNSAFERFWQADTSAAKKHHGVGIGLALVKSLTESMDGAVEIESEYGKGTKFTISVPLLVPPGDSETEMPDDEDPLTEIHNRARIRGALGTIDSAPSLLDPAVTAEPGVEGSANKELVLIAEDETGLRRFLKGEGEEMGCGVLEACDGLEAWEQARQFQPQLIILDYMMPEMDGITLTQRLRQNNPTSQVPILLVTAAADETPRIQALEAGGSDFLTKPFTTAELRLRIRNLLDRQKYQRELGIINQELRVAVEERDVALDEIKENEARLLQAETLSSLGRMSAGIVHEVNNPLNYVRTALHALRMYTEDVTEDERADFEETVADAEEGVSRVIRIVSDLRSFTKGEVAMKEEVVVGEAVENARRLLAGELQGIEFNMNVSESHKVSGNANQLCQVLVNIIQNSAQALEGARERGVHPQIEVSSERAGEQYVCIRVRDNGPGIDPEDLDHIFDPFFTKRDVGEGMGLGLSICHRILESHEGRIEVESDPGHFTVFSVMVPQPWQGDVDSGCETDSEDPESEQGSASRRESRSEAVELEEAWKK
ncbi:MAG: hypothetical protein CMN05_10450 [Roseibacillus sp.]|nr:hypothetical protein [Roseibacillus sp.]